MNKPSRLAVNKSKLAAAREKLAQKSTEPANSSGTLNPMQRALAEISTVEGMKPVHLPIDVNQIDRVFNPREIPCSLDDIRTIPWPDLATEIEHVRDQIRASLASVQLDWWQQASADQQQRVLDFFADIHQLALSLIGWQGQIHNIVVNREAPQDTRFVLLAGERRLIAALYSRGRIPMLLAKVYTGPLTTLQCRLITDQENTAKSLRPDETVLSKLEIWRALGEEKNSMELKSLSKAWHVAIGTASILRRLFCHENQAQLLDTIRQERLGWREIEALVKGIVLTPDAVSTVEAAAHQPPQSQPGKKSSTAKTRTSVRDQLKDSTETAVAAASFGLVLKRNTKLSVVQQIIAIIRDSDQVPKHLRQDLRKLDLDDREAILKAWCLISNQYEK